MKVMILVWIQFFSNQYGVDPVLVESIVAQESNYNPKATGGLGEIGLMQIRKEYLTNPKAYYDPYLNLKEGVKRLAELKRLEKQLGPYWFAAWNLGPTGALEFNKRKHIKHFPYAKEVYVRYAKILKEHGTRDPKVQYAVHKKKRNQKRLIASVDDI